MRSLVIKPLFWLLGLLTYTASFAQQRNQFAGLSAGVMPFQIKDHFHSPYTYRGTGLGLQVMYGQQRIKTLWQLEADYFQANPQSVVSRKAATQMIDAAFNYQWKLLPTLKVENRFQLFAGIGLRFSGNSTNYSPDIEVATNQATAALSLGASAKATYQFSKTHGLELQAFASVISAVYRPHYSYYGKEQFAASWLGRNPITDVQLTYYYQFSRRFQAIARYQLSYFNYDQPRQVVWLRQSLNAGIRRTF
ncbi:hypothetical protein [Larkinella rosea]|uniref:Outer membrane protein beta-barrel domain-containing protein n=1 Tax=Larkinella rosea TaxID=2025312 RepID=A0A3P1C2P0_9BACT|nr:hypothetical protein [Larkinella rosea]RRB07366.1 hypothetical protein EHT25_06195 [Larkinella rosea]